MTNLMGARPYGRWLFLRSQEVITNGVPDLGHWLDSSLGRPVFAAYGPFCSRGHRRVGGVTSRACSVWEAGLLAERYTSRMWGQISASGCQRAFSCRRAGPRVNVHPAAGGKLARSGCLYGGFLIDVLAVVTGFGRASMGLLDRAAELISVDQWSPKACPRSYGLP